MKHETDFFQAAIAAAVRYIQQFGFEISEAAVQSEHEQKEAEPTDGVQLPLQDITAFIQISGINTRRFSDLNR
jgi:hypothetical protein